MKTIPPPCPESRSDREPSYWRGLDQLADTPEFRAWVEREFPAGASEWTDPVSRRHFVKIMSASFLLAGLGALGTGCRRPEEKILPFSKMPENYVHGVAQYFATAMPARGNAIPLVVKSHEGRPVKIEGNAEHPINKLGDRLHGPTDHFAQASILNLYDPDRAIRFAKNGTNATREAALDFLAGVSGQAQANGGQGLSFLMERSHSPSRTRLQVLLSEKFPKARWYAYEPVDFNIHQEAASLAYAEPRPPGSSGLTLSLSPFHRLDQARVVVSLDCDFIGSEEDAYRSIRGFSRGRRLAKPDDSMSRLYAVEALMTLTGANADHRLRVPASAVVQVAAQLAAEILRQVETPGSGEFAVALNRFGKPAAEKPEWITACAKDLAANRGTSLVLAGHRQPLAVHLIAHALNAALGNIGKTIILNGGTEPAGGTLIELAQTLNAGQVETLIILGGNPVYNAPADLDWANTQRKAKTIVRLGYHEDETFEVTDWHLPAAHYLESWGDARTSDGTVVSVQPLIKELFGGLTELEVLARLAGLDKPNPYEVVRETFKGLAGAGDFEAAWRRFLHDGFLADSAAKPVDAKFDWAKATRALPAAEPAGAPGPNALEVVFYRDAKVDDGRFNNNGWLQEMPDPITKLTWDNAILISPNTAKAFDLIHEHSAQGGKFTSQVVEIDLGGRKIKGPIWIQPGLADNTVAIALGYGRQKAGRVGRKTGFNAYLLRTAKAEYLGVGAKLVKTTETYPLATTQSHWGMEGRPIVREANLKQYRENKNFAKAMNLETPPGSPDDLGRPKPLYPNPLDAMKANAVHQWGMSIDLNACVGCSACVLACQSENNVPIVGKLMVGKSREMHWLRIDRYFSGGVEDPQVVNQPMLCQHCEAAPCESVCPVNATVHDEEGLNLMAYNRCVGTRYCSNNCPYKVRRFNFFDFTKRPLDQLYRSPLDPRNRTDGEWELTRWFKNPEQSTRPADEWELMKLVRNPDVTVRMRGVMEKCSFCVQRIEQAKIAQRVKAGASGDVEVPEGTFQTACQQACPAEAIVFGNLNNPKSEVVRLKALDRTYSVLEFLLTKPRTTYLARVRNPNPAMDDPYRDEPATLKEWEDKGNRLESQESGKGAHPVADHQAGKGAI